jgi:hypothetical protein
VPHQNPESAKATEQNAATGAQAPHDRPTAQDRRPEPRSYAAPDVADATLAPPAAGEMGDYADEGEATGMAGQQQGQTNTRRGDTAWGQGEKTRRANRRMFNSGGAG